MRTILTAFGKSTTDLGKAIGKRIAIETTDQEHHEYYNPHRLVLLDENPRVRANRHFRIFCVSVIFKRLGCNHQWCLDEKAALNTLFILCAQIRERKIEEALLN